MKSPEKIMMFKGVGILLISMGFLVVTPFVYSVDDANSQETQRQSLEKAKLEKLRKIHSILKKYQTGLSEEKEIAITELIYAESMFYDYDPEFIMAVMAKESSFYNWSKSRKGALGLMQILPNTGRAIAKEKNISWDGKKTLYDPALNIKLGTHYLASLHKRFGEIEIALTAYNYGSARVARMQRRDQKLPKGYSRRIMETYQEFMDIETQDVTLASTALSPSSKEGKSFPHL